MRVDGYIRVSRVGGREGDSFISPEQQREKIEQWARLHDVQVVEWHVDLDKSGGTLDRPGLDAAMRRIRDGQTDGLAVAALDRLSRAGVPDALNLVYEIVDSGGKFAAIDMGVDPTTEFGEFGLTIMLALARMQRRRVTASWRDARARAVARGVHVASATPTGYRRREDGVLEPHPVYAPVITDVFRQRAGGASWAELGRLLDSRKVEGPYGQINWRTRAVSHIIENRVYLGEARSGEFVNPAAHEPLIDEATWHAAQSAVGAPAVRGEPSLLAGLLRCAGCRHLIKPDVMKDRDGTKLRFYRCRGQHASGTCTDRAAVLGRVVEPYVEGLIRARIRAQRLVAEQDVGSSSELVEADRDLEQARFALEKFRANPRLIVLLGDVEYEKQLSHHLDDVAQAQARVSEIRQQIAPVGLPIFELEAMLGDMTVVEKRKVFAALVDAVVLRGGRQLAIEDRVHVLWRGEMPDDFPRRGRRVPLAPFVWPDDAEGGAGVPVAEDLEEHAL